MKNKRLYVFGLIFLFVVVIIAIAMYTFSIKTVEIEYKVSQRTGDTLVIEKDLQSLVGDSLLFVDEEDVNNLINNQFFETESVEKKFPSTLKIKIFERYRAFYLNVGDDVYTLSDKGIVLEKNPENVENLVFLNLSGNIDKKIDEVKVLDVKIGEKISTDFTDYFYSTLSMAERVNLNDKISEIHVAVRGALGSFDIEFLSKTKTKLYISEAQDDGIEKIVKLFEKYDNDYSDYKKSSEKDEYYVFKDKNNEIKVDFIQR